MAADLAAGSSVASAMSVDDTLCWRTRDDVGSEEDKAAQSPPRRGADLAERSQTKMKGGA